MQPLISIGKNIIEASNYESGGFNTFIQNGVLLPSTFIFDNYGVEIFQGDIVSIHDYIGINQPKRSRLIGTVIFQEASFAVQIKKVTGWVRSPIEQGKVIYFPFLIHGKGSKIKVVGNIYESK